MRSTPLAGLPLVLAAGYFAFKWLLAGPINAERLVALGGMYHWSALTLLTLGWSVWMVRRGGSTQSFWGDFKQLTKPLAVYAILAACSVWGWNHVVAKDATELRKALRLAQIDEHTASDEAYAAFVAEQGGIRGGIARPRDLPHPSDHPSVLDAIWGHLCAFLDHLFVRRHAPVLVCHGAVASDLGHCLVVMM